MNKEEILLESLNRVGNFTTVEQEFNADQLSVIYDAMDVVKNLTIPRVVFSEADVCATCGQTFAKHSAVTRLCPDRFAHFKQT